MKRAAYLDDPDVRDFRNWAAPLVAGTRPFRHRWHSRKWDSWSCETLFDAFRKYEWRFKVDVPGRGECRGRSYADTVWFSTRSRGSSGTAPIGEIRPVSLKRLSRSSTGGGRASSRMRAGSAPSEIRPCPWLTANARLLDPDAADLCSLSGIWPMNSGFSKIYSLLVDGFPIYDSRVACALASLVRLFCEETGREEVPPPLAFGILPSQAKVNRNPSCGCLVFSRIRWSKRGLRGYAQSNVMAAWLLAALSAQPPFSDEREPQRALQSAMFMIGYEVPAFLKMTSRKQNSTTRRTATKGRATATKAKAPEDQKVAPVKVPPPTEGKLTGQALSDRKRLAGRGKSTEAGTHFGSRWTDEERQELTERYQQQGRTAAAKGFAANHPHRTMHGIVYQLDTNIIPEVKAAASQDTGA